MIFGQMRETAGTSEFNSIAFLVQQMIGQTNTATVVQVKAVSNAGEDAPVGTVDVQPLVHQVDGIGQTVPHGVIHGIPYFRLQGGANAVILDPQVGDLGICVFSSRDISHVKASKQASPPGSYRKYSMADGLYIGGILNGTPTQYVRFYSGGIDIKSAGTVLIDAPTIHATGNINCDGDVKAGTISLKTHKHSDPQGGTTGVPQ